MIGVMVASMCMGVKDFVCKFCGNNPSKSTMWDKATLRYLHLEAWHLSKLLVYSFIESGFSPTERNLYIYYRPVF
jgi:hypothetical protein